MLHGQKSVDALPLFSACAAILAAGECLNDAVNRIRRVQVSWALVKVLPLPSGIRGDQAGLFIINIIMGLVCIFVK